jgi:hypothetical protein
MATVAKLYITFVQCGRTILEKTLDDCTVEGNVVQISLTQAETLSFTAGQSALLQIRPKFTNRTSIVSEIVEIRVDRALKGGEI